MKKNIDIVFLTLLGLVFAETFFVSDKFFDPLMEPKLFAFYFLSSAFFIYYFLNKLFIKSYKNIISLNIPDILFLLYYVYIAIRIAFDKDISYFTDQYILLTICLLFYYVVKAEISTSVLSNRINFFFGILNVFVIIHCIIGLIQYAGISQNYLKDFKIGSTYGNPTLLSNLISAIVPISLWGVLYLDKQKFRFLFYTSGVSLVLALITLPLSNARTSWLSALGASLIVLWYRYSLHKKFQAVFNNIFKKVIFVIALIIILTTSSVFLYNYKQNSAFGRAFIWKISLDIIKEHPISGVGYEKYFAAHNDYKSKYFIKNAETELREERITADVPFAFNEFIQTTVELGIIGLLLLGAGIVILLCVKVPYEKALTESSDKYAILAFKACFISILISALFSYPFSQSATLTMFFISAGVLSGKINKSLLDIRINKLIYGTLLLFVLWFVIVQKNIYDAAKKWAIASEFSKHEDFKNANLLYEEVYDELHYNVKFVYNYGVESYFMGNFNKSIELLEKIKPVLNHSDVFINLGSSYEALKEYGKAEECYLHSLTIVPYKFYPRYKLVLIYEKTGRVSKAIKLAKETLKLNPKIYHQNIDYVKSKMIEILNKYDTVKTSDSIYFKHN